MKKEVSCVIIECRKKEMYMKKLVLGLFIMAIMLLPISVLAKDKINLSDYNTLNLEETFKDEKDLNENFTYDLSNYKENDNQITIYLFRGKGCSHCEEFLEYVANTLVPKYGNYFKLVSFETWKDSNNSSLQKKVAAFLEDESGGVPYIIIGDQTFLGYASTLNSQIEAAITNLYNSKTRYDVFEEMNKEEKTSGNTSSSVVIIANMIITTIGVLVVIAHNNSTKKEILNEISSASKKTAKNK